MNFWADAAVDVLIKLEQGTGANVEVSASHGGTGCEMISLDFTSADSFSRFTMFVDGPGTTEGTFYIDDILMLVKFAKGECLSLHVPLILTKLSNQLLDKNLGRISFLTRLS